MGDIGGEYDFAGYMCTGGICYVPTGGTDGYGI